MARTVHIQQYPVPVQHAGLNRSAAGAEAFGNLSANVILGLLALVGKPVTATVAAVQRGLAAWAVARKQRREDEKLWNLALTDARIMADLSRAMSQDAVRDIRRYY
jgi:hypothetical protein